jgi:hypothetical protein
MNEAESIWSKLQELVKKPAIEYSSNLSSRLYVMDIGSDALSILVPDLQYSDKDRLYSLLKARLKTFHNMAEAITEVRLGNSVVFVKDFSYGIFILSNTNEHLNRILASTIKSLGLTKQTSLDRLLAIPADGSIPDVPLSSKLETLLGHVPAIASTAIKQSIQELRKEYAAHLSYVFNRDNFNFSSFTKLIGRGTVVISLPENKHRSIKKLEERIEEDINKYLSSGTYRDMILSAKGSNSFLQDILEFISSVIGGKKSPSPNAAHKKKPTKSATTSIFGKLTASQAKPKQLRNRLGQFSSLATLQRILDIRLAQQIKQNMGTGQRKDILNLRTGRFAESAKVTRISESRAGMLTAFYTYMKYPYQTFEPGFAKGSPASRNPRLLISKSIREILAEQVSNRLRAVLV